MQKQQHQPAQQPGNLEQTQQQQQLEQLQRQQGIENSRAQRGSQKQGQEDEEQEDEEKEDDQQEDDEQEDEEKVQDIGAVLQELSKFEARPAEDTTRRTPGRVTRVVADLMIFVEVSDSDSPLGLVFKPDKIVNYHGEGLADLGISVGTIVSEINWDIATLKVSSVVLRHVTDSPPMSASA
jgi:hypothetical protein